VRALAAFLLGGLLVAVVVLSIHDQQTIATLKRQHVRLKALEG
jgi:hypothetical protein